MPNNINVYVVTTWYNLPNKSTAIDATKLNHIENGIKDVTDFVNTLDATAGIYLCGAPFTQELLTKLNGIEAGANNYTLPTATSNELGGVKVDGSTIVIENGVIRATVSGITTLDGLTDTNISNLSNGQILKWDAASSKWINTSEAEVRTQLSQLTDVQLVDLADGETLKWDEASSKWINAPGGSELSYDDTLTVLGLPPNPIYRYRPVIPTMTSNTTPSGEVSTDNAGSANVAVWKAMDDNVLTRWTTAQNAYSKYIQYHFPSTKIIKKLSILAGALDITPITYSDSDITVQGSNDGTTFTDLKTFTLNTSDNGHSIDVYINNDTAYEYYRLQFTGYNLIYNGYKYNSICSLQMYERYIA